MGGGWWVVVGCRWLLVGGWWLVDSGLWVVGGWWLVVGCRWCVGVVGGVIVGVRTSLSHKPTVFP